jgi:hypothetical protein
LTRNLENWCDVCFAKPWSWGASGGDCLQFGLGWVKFRTGKDPLHDVRYSSAKGAIRRLKERGGLVKRVLADDAELDD